MSTCAGLTVKKVGCSRPGTYPSGGKMYCFAHCPEGDRPTEPKTKSKAAPKKSAGKEKHSDPFEVNDDINDTSSSIAAAEASETCDLIDHSFFRPDRILNVYFKNRNFISAEHAYHFMKFMYCDKTSKAPKILEAAKQIFRANSIEAVRSIAENNSSLIIGKWELGRGKNPTYSDLVMFSILLAHSEKDAVFKSKITSITTDFSDNDMVVVGNVPGYISTLKVLSNYLRSH
jgi:hypothetical protein